MSRNKILHLLFIVNIFTPINQAYGEENTTSFPLNGLRQGNILITPLLDLRDTKTKVIPKKKLEFPTFSQQAQYMATLRQALAEITPGRQIDISGIAFDNLKKLKNLSAMAKALNAANELSVTDALKLESIASEYQFLMFFSFTDESLNYEHARQTPKDSDGYLVENIYTSERKMILKLVLWDIAERTIVASKELNPVARVQKSTFVKTSKKLSAYHFGPNNYDKAIEPDALDKKELTTLKEELAIHPSRFPDMPDRDPELSTALKSLAPPPVVKKTPTQKPIRPRPAPAKHEESKDNFRIDLALKSTIMGVLPLPALSLGVGSLKWNLLRIGGSLEFTPLGTMIDHEIRLYRVYNACISLSADLEWQFGSKSRILTGINYGSGIFTYKQSDWMPDIDGTRSKGDSDGYIYRAPRVRFLYGDYKGGQFGFGVYEHFYDKLERPEIVANHPARYGIELVVAAASGG